MASLSEEVRKMIEADSFWCMQKLLEGIQDNYTLAQPGIQTKIMALKDLIKRLDGETTGSECLYVLVSGICTYVILLASIARTFWCVVQT